MVTLALRATVALVAGKYPRGPFLAAVAEAARYGLYDLDRLERMILRRVARDYFLIGEKVCVPARDPSCRKAMTEELEQLAKELLR